MDSFLFCAASFLSLGSSFIIARETIDNNGNSYQRVGVLYAFLGLATGRDLQFLITVLVFNHSNCE